MMNYTALDLLKKQQDSLITLTKILKDEFEILKSRDRSYLAQNAEKKIIALNIISDVDQAIKTHLIDHPIEPSEQVIFNEQESAVKKLLNQCKHQNKVNGQIINSSQIAINRFKNMMQKSLKNQSATYDSKGLTNLSNTSLGLKA
tara:strand:+ start:1759 stop:2193 length:435 start_codon:yes stop_codon:yes gene_type:complete